MHSHSFSLCPKSTHDPSLSLAKFAVSGGEKDFPHFCYFPLGACVELVKLA